MDYSAQLIAIELSDSHVDQSGNVKTTGKIEFSEGSIPIDNWGLSAIPDGTAITIDVWLDGRYQRHPRGALRSVGTQYSEVDRTLSVEVGCILSARSFAETPDVFLSGVTPGSSVNVQTVADRLLRHGGITTIVNNATGSFSFLDRPQMSGSAIETASKMLASAGAFCWTDSQERVNLTNIDLNPTQRIWSGHAYEFASFERVKNGQPPTEEIKVSGSYKEIHVHKTPVTVGPFREYGPSKYGGTELLKEWESTTEIDFGGAIETTITTTRTNANIVYRAWNLGGNGLVPGAEVSTKVRKFDKNATAHLLSSIETVSKERGLALGPYLDWLHKKDVNSFNSASRYGAVPAEVTEETYKYNSNGFLVQKETIKRNTLASLLGELGDPDWKSAKNLDLAQLVIFEKVIETWEERTPGEWIAYKETFVPQGRAPTGRTGVVAAIEAKKTQAQYIAAIVQAQQVMSQGRNPVESNSGQATPPAPERLPVEYKSEGTGAESIAYFPGGSNNWQPRRSEMQVPYLPDRLAGNAPPTEAAQYYGRVYGGVQQAQWRTLRVVTALDQWLIDGYRPWAPLDIFREGTVYTVAISGTSWVGTQDECLVSLDCALLGERQGAVVNSGVLTTPGTLVPPYLIRGADDQVTLSAAFSSIEPSAVYGPTDTMVSSIAITDELVEQHQVNLTAAYSDEIVEQSHQWIWFF